MVGQYILTNAAQQQLLESRIHNNNVNINSRKAKNGGSIFTDNKNKSSWNTQEEIEMLIKAVNKIEQELNNLKNTNS